MSNQTIFLMENKAIQRLEKYGVPYPGYSIATDEQEVKEQSEKIGYPQVMKILSPEVVHKSDMGGVKVNINSADEAVAAYQQIIDSVKGHGVKEIFGVLICEQAEEGLELIVGGVQDELFGPVIMFGLGGIFVEIMKDVSFRVCPINEAEAKKMINEIKAAPLLQGARGGDVLDTDALAALLVTVSRLMDENREIEQIDLNPVRLYKKGLKVLDARIGVNE